MQGCVVQINNVMKKSLRWLIGRAGYEFIRRDDVPFGYDVMWDIKRLSRMWNYTTDIFFDVGANIGQTTARALRELPKARVFAFEPHPHTFASLKKAIGEVENFKPFNLGFGITIGEVDLYEYDISVLNSMIQNAPFAVHYQKDGKRIQVKSTTIDRFCLEQNLPNIDVLKIDTEGFDLVVLEGSKNMLLGQKIKFIYTEFNDIHPKSGTTGGSLSVIDNFLHPYGYRFIASYTDWIDKDGEFFLVCNALFVLPPHARESSTVPPH